MLTSHQITFWTQFPYILAVSLIKVSILLFYRSIFTTRTFRMVVNIFGLIIFLWTVAFFFASLFQAWPISQNWVSTPNGKMVDEFRLYLVLACTELILDVAILTLPWFVIWKLQMKASRKWQVLGMFMLGSL